MKNIIKVEEAFMLMLAIAGLVFFNVPWWCLSQLTNFGGINPGRRLATIGQPARTHDYRPDILRQKLIIQGAGFIVQGMIVSIARMCSNNGMRRHSSGSKPIIV